jgi:hypothetical protein
VMLACHLIGEVSQFKKIHVVAGTVRYPESAPGGNSVVHKFACLYQFFEGSKGIFQTLAETSRETSASCDSGLWM